MLAKQNLRVLMKLLLMQQVNKLDRNTVMDTEQCCFDDLTHLMYNMW